MIALLVAALLIAGCHAAQLPCEQLIRPLVDFDPQDFHGKWGLVAASMEDSRAADIVKARDSTVLYFYNSTILQINRVNGTCKDNPPRTFSLDDSHRFFAVVWQFNFTATLHRAPCKGCVVMSLVIESEGYKSTDLYLFSQSRQVDKDDMDEFRNQVKCMELPTPFVTDPSKELCPEKPEIEEQEEQS
ncbi:unnamed protein product [Ophioblennius macclurei]